MYQSQLLLEVQNSNGLLRPGEAVSADSSEIEHSNSSPNPAQREFPETGADRMQSDSLPLAPTGRDIFSRLRQRIHPATARSDRKPPSRAPGGDASFDARPIIRTRLIELTTQSTSPDVAAQFLNSMVDQFIEDSTQVRVRRPRKRPANGWRSQIEETKAKVAAAEERLRDFVQASR